MSSFYRRSKLRVNLQAHTNSQDRDLAGEVADDIAADAGVGLRVARTRADNDLGGILLGQFLHSDLVVSEDMNSGTGKHKVLVNVPSERVVVVNEDQIGCGWDWR